MSKQQQQQPSSWPSTSEGPSLSQYLHGVLEPVLDHDRDANEKIQSVDRLNSFLTGSSSTRAAARLEKGLFSPIVSDVHLTIHPPTSSTSTSTSTSDPAANENVLSIRNGIQLPAIDWQREFKKGYTVLMWVRLQQTTPKPSSTTL